MGDSSDDEDLYSSSSNSSILNDLDDMSSEDEEKNDNHDLMSEDDKEKHSDDDNDGEENEANDHVSEEEKSSNDNNDEEDDEEEEDEEEEEEVEDNAHDEENDSEKEDIKEESNSDNIEDEKKEEEPFDFDVWGGTDFVRRSSRSRKEVPRYVVEPEETKGKGRGKKKATKAIGMRALVNKRMGKGRRTSSAATTRRAPSTRGRKKAKYAESESDLDLDESEESEDEEETSDSDSDYGSRNKKRKSTILKKKRRKKPKQISEDEEAYENVRFSTRRSTTVSYAEDDGEDEFLDDSPIPVEEEEPVDEGPVVAVDEILDHKPFKDIPELEYDDVDDDTILYRIKWVGRSHLHNTWELEEDLINRNLKLKKLANYKAKVADKEYNIKHVWSKEDIEYDFVQTEQNKELQETHVLVDRILNTQEVVDEETEELITQYLCKWSGLAYAESTWENAEDLEDFRDMIDEFLDRENSGRIPNFSCPVLKKRPKHKEILTQPSFIGSDTLKLRDYQLAGLNFLISSWCNERNVLLADDMGLGKTIQSVSYLAYLQFHHNLNGPFLIVVPLSTIVGWQREFRNWGKGVNCVTYIGNRQSRQIIRDNEFYTSNNKLKFNALLTTYELVAKDAEMLSKIKWASLIVDEAHRLKNHKGQLHMVLSEFRANHIVLVTGTPYQNSIMEFWALLKFLTPEKWGEWEEFEEKYGADISKSSQVAKLHADLKGYLIKRKKMEVEKTLSNKVERILRVELSSMQREYYRHILCRNFTALTKGAKKSFMNIMVELKKCCNHPFLVMSNDDEMSQTERLAHIVKNSGKLVLLDKLLCRLKETGHRVLIFSQMVRMLDILAEYLQLRCFKFQRLDGNIRNEQREQALDHFNAENSQDFCFLLSTKAGGLGINLATADTVIIFDSDWNPQNDLQAEARAHRIGQKKVVSIYRLISQDSVEEDVFERAKQKLVLDHVVIQRMDTSGRIVVNKKDVPFDKDEMNSIIKFGAVNLFNEEDDQKASTSLENMDIDEILSRAETRDKNENKTAGDEFLSQFNYESFSTSALEKDWDEIIPEAKLEDIREEEKELEQAKLLEMMGPRKVKSVDYFGVAPSDDDDEEGERDGKKSIKKVKGKATKEVAPKAKRVKAKKQPKVTPGFTDAEVRRFIRSCRKFGNCVARLDDIAEDAGLLEKKSMNDLQELSEKIRLGSYEAVEKHDLDEAQAKKEAAATPISISTATTTPTTTATTTATSTKAETTATTTTTAATGTTDSTTTNTDTTTTTSEVSSSTSAPITTTTGEEAASVPPPAPPAPPPPTKRISKIVTFLIGNASVNATEFVQREDEFHCLAVRLAETHSRHFRLSTSLKATQKWDCQWQNKDDTNLLMGIHIYGLGNYDMIKKDSTFELEKILPEDNTMPQNTHLNNRCAMLFKHIKKEQETRSTKTKRPTASGGGTKASARRSSKTKSTAGASAASSSSKDSTKTKGKAKIKASSKRASATSSSTSKSSSKTPRKTSSKASSKTSSKTSSKSKSSKSSKSSSKLDKAYCKDKLRPIRNKISFLGSIQDNAAKHKWSKAETNTKLKESLVDIGEHIGTVLDEESMSKHDYYQKMLWDFVALFAPPLDGGKLEKIYNRERSKRIQNENTTHSHENDNGGSSSNSSSSSSSNNNNSNSPRSIPHQGKHIDDGNHTSSNGIGDGKSESSLKNRKESNDSDKEEGEMDDDDDDDVVVGDEDKNHRTGKRDDEQHRSHHHDDRRRDHDRHRSHRGHSDRSSSRDDRRDSKYESRRDSSSSSSRGDSYKRSKEKQDDDDRYESSSHRSKKRK